MVYGQFLGMNENDKKMYG